eukprot:m.872191 g.872191  ORF g.872191 m.872191 type:complete len:362 (+) comp59775_c1_seq6:2664-3749(+)
MTWWMSPIYTARLRFSSQGCVPQHSSGFHEPQQVLHSEARVGIPKCDSAIANLKGLNSSISYRAHHLRLDSSNARSILEQYDVIVDATDNVATRYLLSDAGVLLGKPVVSGSALRGEGQLTTYHFENGPCYRCLFPTPPPAETVTNCSDGGVLGVIVGIIGTLQALEVLRIIIGQGAAWSQKMLLLDGFDGQLRTIKLRGRRDTCVACGENPAVTDFIDYEEFVGTRACDLTTEVKLLSSNERITCQDLQTQLSTSTPFVLVDTRPRVQFDICALPRSRQIPLSQLDDVDTQKELRASLGSPGESSADLWPLYFVCRRGNDSQIAVRKMQMSGLFDGVVVKDVVGGLAEWAACVDPEFPVY